ncbi:MAG: hypothetical protein ABI417_05390, partial [Coleofasciculaceae cyanobacterium]
MNFLKNLAQGLVVDYLKELLLLLALIKGFRLFKMMPHWLKFSYERNTYLVNLDSVDAFAFTSNGRLIFCLPHSKNVNIVLNP